MGINFIRPYLLILIPLICLALIYSARRFRIKRKSYIAVRCLVLSIIILALCGLNLYWSSDIKTTLFLIDASDSTKGNRSELESFIKDSIKLKGEKDEVGVISFGENSQVESFISKEGDFSKIEGKINGNYTNINNAITTALSLFPNGSGKRIVLLSDGEENLGAVSKITSSMAQQQVDFKYYKVKKIAGEEVSIDSISVPQKLNLGEEFNIAVTLNSSVAESSTINLFNGRTKVGEQKVQLQKGSNKFIFKDKASTGGFISYKVTVDPSKDSEIKNNEATTFTNVVAKPKLLVIQDSIGEADEFVKLLKASNLDYTLEDAASAPRTLSEMTAYKSIITCNVSADKLNDGFLNSIESYVKDFGGGYIATGGDNSFALGGYSKTLLEKVLPVYMDMRGKKETPKMSMVLIIDKSGSMSEGIAGISKVDMAKEAAIRSLEALREGKDEIGVLTFDDQYAWAVKSQLIKDANSIKSDIGTIRADGGTSIIPALREGYNALVKSDAKIKHIILLTDGQAENTGYESLIKDINKDNITVSTVAVGNDADKVLLNSIANQCGGRAYVTDQYTNIPKIFSRETFMAARSYLNNRTFTPVITSNNNILAGVAEGGLPPLLGYIGASEKETAQVLLKSDEDDPILTVWQYGLGKTAAWNSDVSGKWNGNYISWGKNLKLWQNLINFTIENYSSEDTSIKVSHEGDNGTVTLTNKNKDTQIDTSVTIISPSGESKEEKLSETAPGEYTGNFALKEAGVYMINGKQEKAGQIINSVNSGYAVEYSPEYKIITANDTLDKLVASIDGKIITEPKEVFTNNLSYEKSEKDMTNVLLTLALILFMVDVAIRRLNIRRSKFKLAMNYLRIKTRKIKPIEKNIEAFEVVIPVEAMKAVTLEKEIQLNTLDTKQLLRKKKNGRF